MKAFFSILDSMYDEQTMTESDWDWQDAKELGSQRPDSYWVCTDRDVWHKNPCYLPTINCLGIKEPPHPHPDDERYEPVVDSRSVMDLLTNRNQPQFIPEEWVQTASGPKNIYADDIGGDDDVPF